MLVRRSALDGLRGATPLVLGLESGLYFWIVAAGAGLAALVATSHLAYDVLRIVGATVLLAPRPAGLAGGRTSSPRRTYRARSTWPRCPRPRLRLSGRRGTYALGLVTNLANPKAAVFVFAFYPQFLPNGYPLLPTAAGLGLLQVTRRDGVLPRRRRARQPGRRLVRASRVRRGLDVVSGTVLVGLGLRVATEAR